MKKEILAVAMVVTLAIVVLNTSSKAAITIDDGLSHPINDATYQNDFVRLDYYTANSPGTHVELSGDGSVDQLYLHNTSTLNMTGGTVGNLLRGWDNSTLNISGGVIDKFHALDSSTVTISGGTIQNEFLVGFDSTVTMTGGSFESIRAYHDGIVYLVGSDFKVDGQALSEGDKLSEFGTFYHSIPIGSGSVLNYYSGTITGTLLDGSYLNDTFYVASAGASDIIIVPEPCSLVFLGLGGLVLRRRKA